MQVITTISEEMPVFNALDRGHALVRLEYFFDFLREAFLVMSLLPKPVVFEYAAQRPLVHVAGDD